VRLSRTKWPRLVKRIWEPSLPVPVPVQVVERGRVGNVLVVDDEEVAGGVLAVGAAVDGPGPVQGQGPVVQRCGALEVLDEDALDDAGVGVGRDCQAEDGGEAEEDDQK
jgi:hypothetical protein